MERPAISEAKLLYWRQIGEEIHNSSQSLASSQRDISLWIVHFKVMACVKDDYYAKDFFLHGHYFGWYRDRKSCQKKTENLKIKFFSSITKPPPLFRVGSILIADLLLILYL
jgi:hypothetical protein